MALEQISRAVILERTASWARTILVGLSGGVAFGLIIHVWMGNMIDIGAMYGNHSVVRGWIAHLFHSIVGAFVFAGIVSHTRLENHVTSPSRKTAFGVAYGFVLWVVFIGILLPIWLEVMTQWGGGTPLRDSKIRFPASLIGFSVYGVIIAWGVKFPVSPRQNHTDGSGSDSDEERDDLFDSGFIWNNSNSDDDQ